MAVEFIRGLFGRREEPLLIVQSSIEGGPVYKVSNPQKLRNAPINSVDPQEFNKLGITLLSLRDIAKQLGSDRWGQWILFNSLPTHGIGDHWVIASMNKDADTATLAFSLAGGQALYDHVLPFELPINLPFFTGVWIQPLTGSNGQSLNHYDLCLIVQKQGIDAFRQVQMGRKQLFWVEGAKRYFKRQEGSLFLAPNVQI